MDLSQPSKDQKVLVHTRFLHKPPMSYYVLFIVGGLKSKACIAHGRHMVSRKGSLRTVLHENVFRQKL